MLESEMLRSNAMKCQLKALDCETADGFGLLRRANDRKRNFEDMFDSAVRDWPMEEALALPRLSLQCTELRRKDRQDLGKEILPELNRSRDIGEESLESMLYRRAQRRSPHTSQVSTRTAIGILLSTSRTCVYSAPKKKPTLNGLDKADPQLLEYFDKLGVPLTEQIRLANVAYLAVLDRVSITTTHIKTLEKSGVIFCSISEAIREYPDLIKKYLGRVVPSDDNFYAALNSAAFSDGSFCYIPNNTRCLIPISTYFRINAMKTGQFERTLIVAEEARFVEYLEGCTAPSYDTNQLHAAVVELYCGEGAEIKYSTCRTGMVVMKKVKAGFTILSQSVVFAQGIVKSLCINWKVK